VPWCKLTAVNARRCAKVEGWELEAETRELTGS
jgi:hypothetical protein